jgi:cell shape-determining protein MreC
MNNKLYIIVLLIILSLLVVQTVHTAEEQDKAVETTLDGVEGVFLPWQTFYEVNEDLAELDVLRTEVEELERENAKWKEKALRFDVGDFFIGVGVGAVIGGATFLIVEMVRHGD